MAKGVTRSLDTRIEVLREKLEKKQAEVGQLKSEIKELQVAKQAELLAKVTAAAAEKGVTVEELLQKAMK